MKSGKAAFLFFLCLLFPWKTEGMSRENTCTGDSSSVAAVRSGEDPVAAALSRQNRVRFAYDLDFEMNFDNREFSYSNALPSHTIIGARLTPALGVSLTQSNGTVHRLMAGIDVMKDFGRSESAKSADSLYSGEYTPAFVSDAFRWYDNNLEGLLIQFSRPKAYYEVGCDWMGMAGKESRERFVIFSSGKGRLGRTVTLGYAGYMYHFAGSANAPGVVDNILLNPYADFDFSGLVPLQMLHVSVGWLQALQNDRELVHEYVAPGGAEVVAGIGKWNAGISNRFYYGRNIMPYYNSVGTGGDIYATDLYFGNPFYRLRDMEGWHCYDRLEVFYAPRISDYVDLKVAAVLHFCGGYAGWQQMVTVHFNLQELLGASAAGR